MTTSEASTPLVSIVIPVYNGSDFLDQAIDSALSQTYPNVEVVVVNDGSTDDGRTAQIAARYGERIRYLSKPNGGVASALNLGISAMRGEYFSWLSHDDVYHPEKVADQMAAIRGLADDSVIVCAYSLIDEESRPLPGVSPPVIHDPIVAALATNFNGCAMLVPRRCFGVVGLFNTDLRTTQDSDMWLRIASAGFPFRYLSRILVHSRQHAQQGSRTIGTHAAERAAWYSSAVDSLPPGAASKNAVPIASMLLRRRQFHAFARLVQRYRRLRSTLAAFALLCRVAGSLGALAVGRASALQSRDEPEPAGRAD